jgi:hypothetical protein
VTTPRTAAFKRATRRSAVADPESVKKPANGGAHPPGNRAARVGARTRQTAYAATAVRLREAAALSTLRRITVAVSRFP